MVSANTITVTFGTATASKTWALWEVTAAAGKYADYLATGTGAVGASTAPSVTTDSIAIGDMVIGGVAYEYGQAPATSDTDTTNGSWSTRQNANIGSTTSGTSVCTQTKVVSAAGAQTYNPTYTNSSDWAAGYIEVDELNPPGPFATEVLADNPTHLWKHDEASNDAVLHDSIGTLDGSWSGASHTTTTGGLSGDATNKGIKHTRGSGDVLTIPDHASLHVGNGPWWIMFLERQDGTFLTNFREFLYGGNQGVIYLDNTDDLRTDNDITDGVTSAGVYGSGTDTGVWRLIHMVKPTSAAESIHLYVDGVDVTATPITLTFSTTAIGWAVGGRSGTIIDGAMQWLAFGNTDLSPSRIAIHQAARSVAPPAAQTITPGLLTSTSSLYAPTVAPINLLTVPALTSASALYAPTAATKNLLTVPQLDAGPTLYAPTVAGTTPSQPVTLPAIDAVAVLYAPTLATKNLLTVPALDAVSALYAPALAAGPVGVSVGFIDGGPATYAPTVGTVNALAVPLLSSPASVYAPQVQPAQFVAVPAIDAGAALYAPTAAQVGGGTQTVVPSLLDSSPALYAPSLAVGPVGVTLPALASTPAVYAPSLAVGPVGIAVPVLTSTPATYAPTVGAVGGATQGITTGFLDAGRATYTPALAAGPVVVTLGILQSAPALYPPVLIPESLVALPALVSGSALYAPGLTPSWTATVPLLDAGADLFPPVINPAAVAIGLDLLDAGADLYQMTLLLYYSQTFPGGTIDIDNIDGTLVITTPGGSIAGSQPTGTADDGTDSSTVTEQSSKGSIVLI